MIGPFHLLSRCCRSEVKDPPAVVSWVVESESLDIERRHIAALTWDAMFRSRRAAILADGGVI